MTVDIQARVKPRDHAVLFYSNTEELVTHVAAFVVDGMSADETTIVVATAPHIEAFEDALIAAGVDLDAARAAGTLRTIEAGEAISRFLVADWPRADLFASDFRDLIRRCSESGRHVRVYGEMVALLWDAGQVGATIELETMWNQLGRVVPFSLLCVYPSASVAGDQDSFERLCQCHSAVVGVQPESEQMRVTRSFAGESVSLRGARQFVIDTLRWWNLDRLCDDATIVVSELATNALLHARSAFTVAIAVHEGNVRVSVFDTSEKLPVMREPSPTTISGRGLRLITALGTRWGAELIDDGKEVWVEFAID